MAKKTKKKPATKNKPAAVAKKSEATPRRLKQPKYKTLRLTKRIKHPGPKLPGSVQIFKKSIKVLKDHWKLFFGVTIVYGLLTVILVRGVAGGLDLGTLKTSLQDSFNGSFASVSTAAALFSYMVGSAGSSSTPTGGVYQTLLIIIMSLAVIWALRQVLAGSKLRVRDTFYKGTYPLIPFILVLLVIGLQLIPLLLGSWVYGTVISNGIAVTSLEKLLWALFFFLLAVFSLYMICSSLFALYIVTLPDMTPMKALRSARQLVLYRRWTVLRKILFLPFAILLLAAVIMFPLIIFATPLAEWVFFALSMFVLVVVHSYMYTLYRELL
jgi:hypothetical protein